MVFTCADSNKALKHVLRNVLQMADDSPLSKALSEGGFCDIHTVITMTDAEIKDLKYDDKNGNEVMIDRHTIWKLLSIFIHYYMHRMSKGNPIGNDWTAITAEDYNNFRISDYLLITRPFNIATSPMMPLRGQRIRDPIADFKKGIKRDSSSFSVYKDKKQWDTWQHSTLAQARAQDVAEILDRKYVPNSSEERDLFIEKQKFM
jgi:hypothetical protein